MPILWTLLEFDKQVELANIYQLPVYIIKTEFGPEIRLPDVYYGTEESLEEIDKLMSQKPHYPKGRGYKS